MPNPKNWQLLILVGITVLLNPIKCDPTTIWPRPKAATTGNQTLVLDTAFKLVSPQQNPWLTRVIGRFQSRLDTIKWIPPVNNSKVPAQTETLMKLSILNINVPSATIIFDETTDESYTLDIVIRDKEFVGTLTSVTVVGAMRGLESFSQMVQWNPTTSMRFISKVPMQIKDDPEYQYRGVLFDSAHNYFPIRDIRRTIDAMSYTKMNVLHWHMTDSMAWPFKSEKHPLLWQKGAISQEMIYTIPEIRELTAYGLDRGVRIIPALEAPGQTYAMSMAYPELGVCTSSTDWAKDGFEPPSGQLDPTNPKSARLVYDIIDEYAGIFPDRYIHLGGDDISNNCWNSSQRVRDYMAEHGVTFDGMLETFAKGMFKKAAAVNKTVMLWEETPLKRMIPILKDTVVQVWSGQENIKKLIDKNVKVVSSNSNFWNLECGHGSWFGGQGGPSWCDPYKYWQSMYSYDPRANLTGPQTKLVIGGEVTAWSYIMDSSNIDTTIWPRTAAAAEIMWSSNREKDTGNVPNLREVLNRLNNFRHRLQHLGINAAPLQPIWCVLNPGRCNEKG